MAGVRKIGGFKLLVQSAGLALIVINPFLNYYLHFSFVQGWYQSLGIGGLWIVSPLEGIESILVSKTFYLPLLIGMFPPILLAALIGRVFCSWICPVAYLSDLLDRLFGRGTAHKKMRAGASLIWFILAGEVFLSMILAAPVFVFLSPPGLVGREIMTAVFFHSLAVEGVLVLVVLAVNLAADRFFCRHLCPLGGLLSLIGVKRRLVVESKREKCKDCGMCAKACPQGLAPDQGQGLSPHCWNCGACVDACGFEALEFVWVKSRRLVPGGTPPLDGSRGSVED